MGDKLIEAVKVLRGRLLQLHYIMELNREVEEVQRSSPE